MNDIENYGNRYHVLQSFPMPQLAVSVQPEPSGQNLTN